MTTFKEHSGFITALFLIAILFGGYYYYSLQKRQSAINHQVVTQGKIDKLERTPKYRKIKILYHYFVDGIQYNGQRKTSIDHDHSSFLLRVIGNQGMIVVYDATDTANSLLPLTDSDFDECKLQIPGFQLAKYLSIDSIFQLSP